MRLPTAPLPPALTSILDSTVRSVRRLYGASGASVALTSQDGDSLLFVAAAGEARDRVLGLQISTSTGIAGWVAMSQQQMAVADVTQDPRFARDVAESIGYLPTAILAAPLPGEDGALGVIEVLDPDAARRGDIGTLSLVGSLLAAVVSHAAESNVDARLAQRLLQVEALGPRATDLVTRLVDAVLATWDAGE